MLAEICGQRQNKAVMFLFVLEVLLLIQLDLLIA